jgi:hypothetical protein
MLAHLYQVPGKQVGNAYYIQVQPQRVRDKGFYHTLAMFDVRIAPKHFGISNAIPIPPVHTRKDLISTSTIPISTTLRITGSCGGAPTCMATSG